MENKLAASVAKKGASKFNKIFIASQKSFAASKSGFSVSHPQPSF
jgi:hypothetical protein